MRPLLLLVLVVLATWLRASVALACSSSGPPAAALSAPMFEGESRITDADVEISCQDGEPPSCRVRAVYHVERRGPTRAAVVLLRGTTLKVHAGRQLSANANLHPLIVSFESDVSEITVEGSWELAFGVDPCVGPGYMARHRWLRSEGRARTAMFRYVVPDRSVRHRIRVIYPRSWAYDGVGAHGELPPTDENQALERRALREAGRVWDAFESGDLEYPAAMSVEKNTRGEARHDASLRALQIWLVDDAGFLQNAGAMLAAGFRFGVGRPWFRVGYEVAAPSWVLEGIGLESDLRDNWVLVPSLELVGGFGRGGGDRDGILGAGIGVPIELSGEKRVFGRAFVSASSTSLGLVLGLDYAPETRDFAGNLLGAVWF
jgi:hypothetical protein